jgi:predicted nucleic acid-binding protein
MSDKAFIDTNIYVYTQRTDAMEKKYIAEAVINYFDCVSSTQVLNEISNIFTKKYPLPLELVNRILDAIITTSDVAVITHITIKKALQIHEKYQCSYYDSLMISSAIEKKCAILITEDMQDGQVFEDIVKAVNIFNHKELLNRYLTDK